MKPTDRLMAAIEELRVAFDLKEGLRINYILMACKELFEAYDKAVSESTEHRNIGVSFAGGIQKCACGRNLINGTCVELLK